MQAESAGEKAVSVADLKNVSRAYSVHCKAAHYAVLPYLDVVHCVGYADGLAGRAAGAMEPNDFVHRGSAKPHRILVAQVGLLHEGEKFDVGERLDVLRPYSKLVAALAEEGDTLIRIFHGPLEPMQLKFAQLADRYVVDCRNRMRRRVDIMRQGWVYHLDFLFF